MPPKSKSKFTPTKNGTGTGSGRSTPTKSTPTTTAAAKKATTVPVPLSPEVDTETETENDDDSFEDAVSVGGDGGAVEVDEGDAKEADGKGEIGAPGEGEGVDNGKGGVQFKGKKWRKQREALGKGKALEVDLSKVEDVTSVPGTGEATTPTQSTPPAPFDLSKTSLTETSLSRAKEEDGSANTSMSSSTTLGTVGTASTSPSDSPKEDEDTLSPLTTISPPSRETRHYSLSSEPETPSTSYHHTSLASQNHALNKEGGEFNSVSGTVYRNSGMVDVSLMTAGLGGEEVGLGIEERAGDGKMGKETHDFLVQRLESQNSMIDRDPKAKRLSNDGTSKIRQSFARIQRSALEDPTIDWDFWGAVMNDYERVASTQPRELSRAIQLGIPPALRGMTWQLMAASKDQDLESIYSELLKQPSPHEKSIQRDLSRTFPKHEYFQEIGGSGQENLFNVVKAYSLYDEEVGYTQGLQFIVGPLLLNMPDEEAFCVLVRLMKSYDLRSHYTPNMPGLQLRLFQFDRLIEELLPGVFMHLLRQGVKSSMYASQWFLTLFGYRFPLELVSSVFDLVFAEGVEAVFRFSVAILKKNEEKICSLEFEYLVEYLKNGLFESYAPEYDDPSPDPLYKAHEFVREALQVKITPLMLDQFGEEWDNLCRQQSAHTAEIENLRKANMQLSQQVRSLEASLSQINIEHCDLVKQVVLAKLEREELEDELVKYKIAFADLSHQQASSGSRFSQDQEKHRSQMSM